MWIAGGHQPHALTPNLVDQGTSLCLGNGSNSVWNGWPYYELGCYQPRF